MSGITGLYHLDGRGVMPRDLRGMTRLLAHRGPDAAGVWIDGGVGLGHCLRHTTPASLQAGGPTQHRDAALVITADARLDNRVELLSAFGWPGDAGCSDAALILEAYARWGTDSPAHLLGAFAFALWDASRRCLFCARDHLGTKPFYYVRTDDAFAFASEIKALFALPRVPRRLHETRVADYLMNMTQDAAATFYEGILRLPPAHTLTVTPDGLRLRRYWALDAEREVRYATDDAYAEAYRDLFTDAVRCRLRSPAPVGAFLSGGLDSSSVTCMARDLRGADAAHPLDTFSLVFEAMPRCDERPYIDAVLAQGGLRPHYVHGDRAHPLDDLDRMLWHTDEPFFTPNLFLHWQLFGSVRDHGVGVVLDGFLGDNVVSHGDHYFTELAAGGRWLTLGREMHAVAGLLGSRRHAYRRLLRHYVLTPLVREPLQRARDALTRPALPASPVSRFINPDLARRVGWMERARAFGEAVPRTPRSARAAHAADLASGLLPGALEIANKAAAAFGVDARFPFADRRLLEFCLAVPATQKYRDGWTRVIARRALRDVLPRAVHRRYGKTRLHPTFNRSLFVLAEDALTCFIYDRLPAAAAYIDVDALQQAYRQVRAQQQEGRHQAQDAAVLPIWRAVMLTRWLEREAETAPARAVPRPETDRRREAVPCIA